MQPVICINPTEISKSSEVNCGHVLETCGSSHKFHSITSIFRVTFLFQILCTHTRSGSCKIREGSLEEQ